ncbi:cysteine peptidase family C39 domain-containing protein [Microcoleus sp. K4-B3]
MVVEGFGKKCVYLNDPATGRRTVSLEEFDRAYTGVILVMEPGPSFQKGGKKRNTLAALVSRLRHSWGTILFCLFAGFLLNVPRYDRLLTGIAVVFASINFFALQLMLRTRKGEKL